MKAKEEAKKEIRDYLYLDVDVSVIVCGTLKNTADNILALEKRLRTECDMVIEFPRKYSRFEIEFSGIYSGEVCLDLYGVRKESNEEFKHRVEVQKAQQIREKANAKLKKEAIAKRELTTFLRLQKKFGKK